MMILSHQYDDPASAELAPSFGNTCYSAEVTIPPRFRWITILLAAICSAHFAFGNDATEPYAGKTSKQLGDIIAQADQSIQQNPNDPRQYYQRGPDERALAGLEKASVRAEGVDHPPSPAEMETFRAYQHNMEATLSTTARSTQVLIGVFPQAPRQINSAGLPSQASQSAVTNRLYIVVVERRPKQRT